MGCVMKGLRAYPGSELVVANTLAKWKKLEPNVLTLAKVLARSCSVFNSFPTSVDFCCLLITFANSLDPDQARQNVGPDLDPNCLTPWWYWEKNPASKELNIAQ